MGRFGMSTSDMDMSLNATHTSTLRVGDDERDACVAALVEHHLHGRLSVEELDHRQQSALAAVTGSGLAVLVADLPDVGPVARRGVRPVRSTELPDKVASAAVRALPAGAIVGCAWLSQVAWQFSAEGPFLGAIAGGVVGYAAHAAVARFRR
ncbi:hypothetical protein ASG88_16055 [Nocardioides sp. Soil777]|nr:hypothetical protein ASG88_16055 [Nocardioides sp. Soil777]